MSYDKLSGIDLVQVSTCCFPCLTDLGTQQCRNLRKSLKIMIHTFFYFAESELELSMIMFTKALDLCCWLPQPQLFSQLCQCLSLCYGRTYVDKAVHYLNLSLGVTLRYEAANSSRKKIRYIMQNLIQ